MNPTPILVSIFLLTILGCHGQTASTPTSDDSATPEPLDAYAGGKQGSPGAQLRFSAKALDSVIGHAMDLISKSIKSMLIPRVVIPLANGLLTVQDTRITEVKFAGFQRQLSSPNLIRSCFHGGRLVSIGQWTFKQSNGEQRTRNEVNGLFRTIVVNSQLNMTNKVGQTWPGKPRVETIECNAYLGQFRVEIEGFGDNTTVIDQCDNLWCRRIRQYFQNEVCKSAKSYVNDFVNQKLSTIPTRINLGPSGNRFVLNYDLLFNEPKVTEQYVQGHLEGEVLSRNAIGAPFHANPLSDFDDENSKEPSTLTFRLSDYAFNTLFHHAHAQQFKFSAYDMVPASSQIRDYLKMRCPSTETRVSPGKSRSSNAQRGGVRAGFCLGAIFENATLNEESDGLGDLVFKTTQRPFQVIVDGPPRFGVDGGVIEAYGAAGADGKRELLGRADVRFLRASFVTKLSGCNITGDVVIYNIQLIPSATAARLRTLPDPIISKLSMLSVPVFTDVFRAFLAQYAQFPVPLFEGLECQSPQLKIDARTMQLTSEIKILPEATRLVAKKS